MLKRTPLFETHARLGARLIDFGGWEMPVQYSSIVDEHHAVRKGAGIFDISHMGEIFVSGAGAAEFLNHALTNDVRKLTPGLGQYSLMCNETGGVVDDLYVYCLGHGNFLLMVNASRIDQDFEWLERLHQKFPRRATVFIDNKSDSYGALALQGPAAAKFIDQALGVSGAEPSFNLLAKNQVRMTSFRGELIYVARTGYTGEDGFEIIAPAPLIVSLWSACMEAGQPYGLKPAGLGARDTLRTEACYPLYGHELNETTTPIEAGLGFFVSADKSEFMGSQIILAQKASSPPRKLIALKMTSKSAPPRPDYLVFSPAGERLGTVVSGTQSPTAGAGIGLAYVPADRARIGETVLVEIRGNRFPAEIVKKPFYKRGA